MEEKRTLEQKAACDELIETLSDIDKISAEIHKAALSLQELEQSLYTIQKKIYMYEFLAKEKS